MYKTWIQYTENKVYSEIALKRYALPEKNKDHNLTGNYVSCRECHIQSDWLLIYQLFDNDIILIRTGTHSDLFS